MEVHLNFFRQSRVPTAPEVLKIQAVNGNNLRITRMVNGNRVVTGLDFSNAPITEETQQSPNSYADTVYRWDKLTADALRLWVAVAVPMNTPVPEIGYQVQTHTARATIWKATGEDSTLQAATETPSWIPSPLTDADRKARVIAKIKRWRQQIKKWLMEAPQYGDLVPNIVTHLGYWLRSADYTLASLYEDTDGGLSTAMSWDVLEAVIDKMILGPTSLDPDGDGSYEALFFQRLLVATASFPTGPTFGALWVNWWALDNNSVVGDVERVGNMVTDVLADAYIGTRRRGVLSETYNPLAEYWSTS